MVNVTVWGENVHDQRDASVQKVYPDTMHETIAAAVRAQLGDDVNVRTAWLQQEEHGLTEEVLADTDVLTWWESRRSSATRSAGRRPPARASCRPCTTARTRAGSRTDPLSTAWACLVSRARPGPDRVRSWLT